MLEKGYYKLDCMIGMKEFPDKYFDLAVVDPEQGKNEHGGINRSKEVLQNNGSRKYVEGNKYKRKNWDLKPAGKDYFRELFRVSKHQIIWGCNYYYKNFGPGRIIWDKCNEGATQFDCEIAYNSLCDRVELLRYMWRGMMQGKSLSEGYLQQGNKKLNEHRIHPTQKPVLLYRWIVKKYIKPGWKVIDTHVGSASSLIAYELEHIYYVGFEIDPDYFLESNERLKNETKQCILFE